ncbi:MAG: ABC transporter ATP-binding protein, partial [Thermoplasmata archaeon]
YVDELLRKKVQILDDISFSIKEGENLAMIGPNGCGKTTLLKIIATIYLPDSGTVEIFGNDINEKLNEARKYLSFVSPGLSFQNKLTLRETLKFFCAVLDKKIDEVYPFLERMNIMHMLDKRLEGFSEGQKGMVRLAIGLLKSPRILLLDEVVANLDVERKEIVIEFLNELDRKLNFTIIMVDHDPSVVDKICDKILILKQGGQFFKLVAVDELMKSLPYKFDVNVTFKKAVNESFAKQIWSNYRVHHNTVRYFTQSEDEVEDLTRRLMKNHSELLEFSTSGVSLEDVYWMMMNGELK